MREADLMRLIQLACSERGHRVFRNNVGKAWIGESLRLTGSDIKLRNARYFHAGLGRGSSDLIGWTRDGRFLAIEVKTAYGRLRTEQQAFLDAVRQAGGVAFVARRVEDVGEALG